MYLARAERTVIQASETKCKNIEGMSLKFYSNTHEDVHEWSDCPLKIICEALMTLAAPVSKSLVACCVLVRVITFRQENITA